MQAQDKLTRIDADSLKKQYEAHLARCQDIAREVEKWGKKTKLNLNICVKGRE